MNYEFIKKEIESIEHNIKEAGNLGIQSTKVINYIKQQNKELKRLLLIRERSIRDFNKIINFDNCHFVVEYLINSNPKLIEAIVNEYEAQIRFNKDIKC